MKSANTESLLEKVKRDLTSAEQKRKEREIRYRCVYSYWRKDTKEMTDNLLLLPYANEAQNKAVFERHISGLVSRAVKDENACAFVRDMRNVQVRYLGVYDKTKNAWFKKAEVDGEIVLDCAKYIDEISSALDEINRKKGEK